MPRWTPEARAKQAAKIKSWQPWRDSTGPKTHAGKARSSQNALKSGEYSAGFDEAYQRAAAFLAQIRQTHRKLRRV
ncbi:MAG: hypothetical protein ABTQ93_16505 [Candidatus Competibacter denitrificans]